MVIEDFFTGVFPDGTKFRVRRINEMWFYAVQIKDEYDGWVWHTVYRSPSKMYVVQQVLIDRAKREERSLK